MSNEGNPRAVIGGNNPPVTPYEAILSDVSDLMETATGFLDGEPIKDQATADRVGQLIDEARKGRNAADELRKAEAKPFDDGKKAVQEKWTPITDEKKGKYALIISTAKRALTPWLEHLEDEQRRIAEEKRVEAEKAAQAAREAEITAQTDLAAAEKAEAARMVADDLAKAAGRAEKAKPQATGGSRAIGLRTSYRAEIINAVEFARWAWTHRQTELLEALEKIAAHEATGPKDIPGLNIIAERIAA